MNLVMIGLRGSGKSTVGKILAERLGWPFYDCDRIVEERAGRTIRDIFEQHGEPEFRKQESAVVLECAARTQTVIATGGGAIVDPVNTAALKRDGFIVHLSAEPSVLWHRILEDPATAATRPQLVPGAESGIDELKKLMLARAGVYAHARNVEVDVEDRTPNEVADAVMVLARAHGVLKPPSVTLGAPPL